MWVKFAIAPSSALGVLLSCREAATALGRDQALAYLRSVAESSAALSDADDIDRYFDR